MGIPKGLWGRVIKTLEDLVPHYDRGNKALSLLQDWRFRIKGLSFISKSECFRILDLGGGPGTLEYYLAKRCKHVIYLDASFYMTLYAKKIYGISTRIDFINAVFEALPFRSEVFDYIITSFAIRDSLNMVKALDETSRVCKGKFIMVEVGKPDNTFIRLMFSIYLKVIVPFLTALATGIIRRNPWRLIYHTYLYLPENSTLKMILSRFFRKVEVYSYLLGAVIIALAEKT